MQTAYTAEILLAILTAAVLFWVLRGTVSLKCRHSLEDLHVEKKETHNQLDDDWSSTTYYFRCGKCGALVNKEFVTLNKTAEQFLYSGSLEELRTLSGFRL